MNDTMEEDHTWRTLLGKIIAEPKERLRISNAVKVSPVTLVRWTTNKSHPHSENLQLLLSALPNYREELIKLINKEHPHGIYTRPPEQEDFLDIPAAFYAQVLNTYTASPAQLRQSTICTMLLQQILHHLDPHQLGTMALLACCVKPRAGRPVRSLMHVAGQSTPSWQSQIAHLKQLLGAESLAGHALITKHPIIIQNSAEIERIFPVHVFEGEESAVAYPILLADRTAGCLYVASTQTAFFTPRYLDLIQKYVDLFVIAFDHKDFYALSNIILGIMPSRTQQSHYMTHFDEYVAQLSQQSASLTPAQIETIVWQDLEDELLRHSPP